jgi:hypothetical protein
MFDWLKRLFFAPKERVPLDPDRVDKLSLEDWGTGEAPKMYAGNSCPKCGTKVKDSGGHGPWCPNRSCKWGWETEMDGTPLDPRGGYGGPAIPGDDLPASIPRVPGPATHELIARHMGSLRKGPAIPGEPGKELVVPDAFNYTQLAEVKGADNTRAASITNGYDRDILLEGPVLKMFLKKGETRTIRGPVFQRVPRFPLRNEQTAEKFNPAAFDILGHAAVDVLKDMAAERTRSILRGQDTPGNVDNITVGRLLELSKFTVTEL